MATPTRSDEILRTPAPQYFHEALTCEDDSEDWSQPVASDLIGEDCEYAVAPTTLSHSIQLDLDDGTALLISRSASVDDDGDTLHCDDLPAQIKRTFANLSNLLRAAGASWAEVVRTTWFVRDVATDGPVVRQVLRMYCLNRGIRCPGVMPMEAILCRNDLLVEAEAVAIIPARAERQATSSTRKL